MSLILSEERIRAINYEYGIKSSAVDKAMDKAIHEQVELIVQAMDAQANDYDAYLEADEAYALAAFAERLRSEVKK